MSDDFSKYEDPLARRNERPQSFTERMAERAQDAGQISERPTYGSNFEDRSRIISDQQQPPYGGARYGQEQPRFGQDQQQQQMQNDGFVRPRDTYGAAQGGVNQGGFVPQEQPRFGEPTRVAPIQQPVAQQRPPFEALGLNQVDSSPAADVGMQGGSQMPVQGPGSFPPVAVPIPANSGGLRQMMGAIVATAVIAGIVGSLLGSLLMKEGPAGAAGPQGQQGVQGEQGGPRVTDQQLQSVITKNLNQIQSGLRPTPAALKRDISKVSAAVSELCNTLAGVEQLSSAAIECQKPISAGTTTTAKSSSSTVTDADSGATTTKTTTSTTGAATTTTTAADKKSTSTSTTTAGQ